MTATQFPRTPIRVAVLRFLSFLDGRTAAIEKEDCQTNEAIFLDKDRYCITSYSL